MDFTTQGRRPSVVQIMKQWRAEGRPDNFIVKYGETFAEFTKRGTCWDDSGNGCRGVDRSAVVKALNAEAPMAPPGRDPDMRRELFVRED